MHFKAISVFLLLALSWLSASVLAKPLQIPPVKTTSARRAPTSTAAVPAKTATTTRLAIGKVVQKFSQWKPRSLGNAAAGANFPRGDPDGSQRLQRALALRAKWNSQRPGQGKAKRALSSAWDLSNVNGVNYLTTIKDQGSCGTCVSFATTAALEASILFRSGAGSNSLSTTPDLSEQFLYYCLGGRTCDAGWWIDTGVITAASNGDLAETCLPYSTTSTQCSALQNGCDVITSNINATLGSLQPVALNDWDSIRSHIINYGPISTGFSVYSDFPGFQDSSFYTFNSNYVWSGTKTNVLLGGHAVSCFGFDDNMLNGVTTTSTGVLFCKNSWGTAWGNNGFFKIAYGTDGIMSGGGDTYGFIFTPFAVPTTSETTAAPPTTTVAPLADQTTTAVAPTIAPTIEPTTTTTDSPQVVTTLAPNNQPTTTVAPPPTVAPTTTATQPPAPPPATTAKPTTEPPRPTRTVTPIRPVRKLESYVCQNNGGIIPRMRFSCEGQSYGGPTYVNVTYFEYGRDTAGVRSQPATCPKANGNKKFVDNTLCGAQPLALVGSQCNGYKSCSVTINDATLGKSGCGANVLKLARVRFDCLPATSFAKAVKPGEKSIGK